MAGRRPPSVIGWREWVSLPDLGVPAIRAKIDTGARSAALHAHGLEVLVDEGIARFSIHADHRVPGPAVMVEAPLIGERRVRNPGGRTEIRPVIRTTIRLGGFDLSAEVTLTRRDEMGFPMLLGRQTVKGRFLIDAGKSYLLGAPPQPEGD